MTLTKNPRPFYCYFWKSYFYKTKKHQWIVKWKGEKKIVNGFKILVPIQSKSRKTNPHAVVTGLASKITVRNKIATIQ
jgi:hypothetical protein